MPLRRICLVVLFSLQPIVFGQDAKREGIEFFEKRIRPILIRQCYACHSSAATELKGGLRLDSRELIRKGGESGPAVVPGDKKKSLLLDAIRHASFEMPPDKKLPDQVIKDFEKWVAMGAPDPRDQPPSAEDVAQLSWQATLAERRKWWSLQPVVKPPVPQTKSSSVLPIDAFVRARQQAAGVAPAQRATARILARRLSLVLTGLPPTSQQVEEFVEAAESDFDSAYESLVDRLLSSHHFGELWARHWMDVVRFAETHGYEWNHEVRDAWRYRDYLIRGFNQDVPYDQLVREHIAGDLLAKPRRHAREGWNESIIGTAFWRFGELGHDNCVEFPEIRFDALDNQIDTFAKAFQGLTISCARCHDHKLDAISSKDYYALVAVLENCSQVVHTIDSPQRISDVVAETKRIKSEVRSVLAKKWLAAIDKSDKSLRRAMSTDQEFDKNAGPLRKYAAVKNRGHQNPGYILHRLMTRGKDADTAKLWQQLGKEYKAEQARRKKFNQETFAIWADFGQGEQTDWSKGGLGLSMGPTPAGEFILSHAGDRIVTSLLPGGIYTNVVSDRLNGSLRSPWVPTSKKFISLQLVGDGRSMVRPVVDSCGLNEFAGGGLEYLAGGATKWKRLPTSAGATYRSFVELTTKSDNPRWPDRPGRAGTSDKKELQSPRSSFGVMRVVLHDKPEVPLAELDHLLKLFEQGGATEPEAGIVRSFQVTARQAIQAWSENRANDGHVHWINWLLEVGILPNSAGSDPQLAKLLKQYRETESSMAQPRVVAGLADQGRGGFPLLRGGDPLKRGPVIQPRYIEVLAGATPGKSVGSGRLQLAEVVASSSNPLTARVMVNRVWHHLFGRGIVATTDDFGRMGDKPTHPRLLDFLAADFVNSRWSIKGLIRKIVLSETFRASSRPDQRAREIDPGNALLHHYPIHRLDAESIRDTLLAVSGRLDRKLFGPSIHPHRKEAKDYRKLLIGPLDGQGRRSIYTKVTRMEGPQFLQLFDFPNPMATRGRRDRTNVPAQALALLNDPFVMDQSKFWGKQLVATNDPSVEARIRRMFLHALGRPPGDKELRRFTSLVRQLADVAAPRPKDLLKDAGIWQDAAHAMFNMKELIYVR